MTRYVLIHGGGSTGRFWDRLLPCLDRPSLAVDLPGRAGRPTDLATLSVDEEVASVVSDILTAWPGDPAAGGSVVLVAHSSGGLVVPGVVAALGGRVGAVVLDAALVPSEGGCGIDCMKERHREGLVAARRAAALEGRSITLPGPPADPEAFRHSYGTDPLADETLTFAVDPSRCVPDTVHHYFQPVYWSEVAGVPITYVINLRDRPVAPSMQEVMAGRLPSPCTVLRVAAGHLLPVSDPALFATILSDVATALEKTALEKTAPEKTAPEKTALETTALETTALET